MKQLDQNPENIRQEVLTLSKLNHHDLKIIRSCKNKPNQLGLGYQIGFVRTRNYFPKQRPFEIDTDILSFICYQLNFDTELIVRYSDNRSIIQAHQSKIKEYLCIRKFGHEEKEHLEQFLLEESHVTDSLAILVPKAQCFLKDNSIIQPALSSLRRIAGNCRKISWKNIENNILKVINQNTQDELNKLLNISGDRSLLWRLKQPPGLPSSDNMKTLFSNIQTLEAIGIPNIDLSWLNTNYQNILAKKAQYYSVHRLNELKEGKKYASLICLCKKLYTDSIDYAIDMLIKLLDKADKSAIKKIDEDSKKRRNDIKKSLGYFQSIGEIILDDNISDKDIRSIIYNQVSKDDLCKQIVNTSSWLSGKYNHIFYLLKDKHNYFMKFMPSFLKNVQLKNDGVLNSKSLLKAIDYMKNNATSRSDKNTDDIPVNFIPNKHKKYVFDDKGEIDKKSWEVSLFTTIKSAIKEGNLSATNGSFFCSFDKLFMRKKQWAKERKEFFNKSNLPATSKGIKLYLTKRLHKAIDNYLRHEPDNEYASVEDGHWVLSKDGPYVLSDEDDIGLSKLKYFLKRHMRKIKLPELLIEVDNDLHISNYFMPYEKRRTRNKDTIVTVIAAWMSWGCGIGNYTMTRLVQNITYEGIESVSNFYISDEDCMRYALADVVNAISGLGITGNWGIGLSSSSDSIRMEYQSKVLHRGYSACFGDFAVEFQTFVADTYAPYFSKPIECTNRDAGHSLDGLLYHESGLTLLDHYVDTHGYTEINFAAFTMFGKQLNPRIKNVKSQRLYKIDPNYQYGSLAPLLKGKSHIIDMDCIEEQYDRMGWFYASMASGHTTASNAMRRLASFSDKNRFYKANREFGRVIKTENILKYMADPSLREKRRRGLLKTEQLHQLSREVAYGKHGKIKAREFDKLKNSCSCLTLIDACIVYWQSKEMMRVCEAYDAAGQGIDLSLLKHVSPIEWSNLILYGDYQIKKSMIK
jgi:TnpA family transposase